MNFFKADFRSPVGFYPSSHHQLPVFLRIICFIIISIKPYFRIFVKKKEKNLQIINFGGGGAGRPLRLQR
jgi:hypothetical protein